MQRKSICIMVSLLLLLSAAATPALAAPMQSYTKAELESALADGTLTKLWLANSSPLMTLENGRMVASDNGTMYGESVYCEDTSPENGYLKAYVFRWGYNSDGEISCYLKSEGYIAAGSLSTSQPPSINVISVEDEVDEGGDPDDGGPGDDDDDDDDSGSGGDGDDDDDDSGGGDDEDEEEGGGKVDP